MKVYIATKFEDTEIYNNLKNKLEVKGYEITCDWTKHKKVHPFSENKELCYSQSLEDVIGIEQADVMILLYNGKKGSGMSFEIGYATALGKKILMYAPNNENISTEDYSMFVHLENFIHVKSKTQLFDVLLNIEKGESLLNT